ncbi:50S ribosomal protein L6 [Candidatus Uhrbacteria bacterium RIFCSPLOWO2_01_FULL_47_24]|uniref:Large ribosomal subunit protein uL6 n=1 Tax=Candidatus Uhrbacteria bacterium RIFCSPLOWO2_01_FULL_47_24 TaxID=1802401 RepID=A0A1F7UVB0_9BACT|nr:MAG: 50S ribosomal protein L6 [Candidatus Uhrbacteria bacterium RIFCSPHIGHO2_01_FULL_47_11]OGL68965.1 MAG: 50S ribosomal protein L6 [Candidatus Uhrbacteria bacterium RIFCSPHIGHO2_02_FULL_46_47]OGL74918.1 MAG: 50S ribosomal protein L6 [Candidatus Uhrbacteria bacterium RIFCSPHIGHO2_12_FULL_47_11]OGL81658.1 MAG: 50S ribosomal protein L6 [Candidatus Uhrbacteria bacterium RIFCSPLOWO2_01_FULL_47_24]OGL85089.1 MAG: 50S ribosomal protein L6 [Candidatus Uhrbacteria bacterium RIFCSPLOWO2_02_FULL_46_25
MSRIGKKPIAIPSGVTAEAADDTVVIKGPKGELKLALHPEVTVMIDKSTLAVLAKHPETKEGKALWGLHRALLANMIAGVVKQFEKKLEMVGVGYKAAVQGQKLILEVGFSHPVEITIPSGISGTVEKNVITISGIDKQLVGQISAAIRSVRKPEPYKGKGIKYAGEVIRRKAGKAAKAAGAK